jgi:hypothetical protein
MSFTSLYFSAIFVREFDGIMETLVGRFHHPPLHLPWDLSHETEHSSHHA